MPLKAKMMDLTSLSDSMTMLNSGRHSFFEGCSSLTVTVWRFYGAKGHAMNTRSLRKPTLASLGSSWPTPRTSCHKCGFSSSPWGLAQSGLRQARLFEAHASAGVSSSRPTMLFPPPPHRLPHTSAPH
jgi:hypothetical protein